MGLIKCSECGKEISDKAANCPNCGAPNNCNQQIQTQISSQPQQNANTNQKNQGKVKDSVLSIIAAVFALFTFSALIGFIIAIIDLATANNKKKERHIGSYFAIIWFVLFVIVMLISNTAKKKENTIAQNNSVAESIVQSESEEKHKTDQEETEEAKSEEKDKYNVGDTWNNKYVLVSYDECGEYTSDNQFIQPADGNKYIYAKFTFENVGTSDTTVGSWDFDCYADGFACDGTYAADDAAFSQTLSAGRKISGSVYFEVPADATEIEFEYSPNFWTSEKIVFVYSE